MKVPATRVLLFASFTISLFVATFSGRAELSGLPPNPRLLLNAAGIAQLKERIAAAPWAQAEWEKLTNSAEAELGEPIVLPPRGGNWGHNYVCPIHGARLRQGKEIGPWQWEHICPVGDHILHGDTSKATLDFDGACLRGIHDGYAEEVVNHGLVYQMTGDVRHARKAREILLAYAERYLAYPLHDNEGKPGKGGRVASQSLTEATWLIPMLQGADLVWVTLSEADRRAIADKLIMPALKEVIIPSNHGIHNIQCRLNSSIGLAGLLLGDQKLVSLAIDGPVGYRAQMAKGVMGDGMWLEGSSGYHFFTIAGVWPLLEAARNCGIDLYGPKFQSMFDGPLALAMPNFSLPNFNDSSVVALQGEEDFYELALARYHNLAYASILSRSRRHGQLALLFGETKLPTGERTELGSRNSTGSGYAMLQRGPGKDATWLCVKYGAHGGWHGHPDKNNFILYTQGEIVAPDAGTHAYGSPLHENWDRTTFAHNTLVVDQVSQDQATGTSLAFGTEQGVDYSVTDAGAIYHGVHFIRTAAMLTPELIVFVDQIQADAPHTFDLVYHQMGTWEGLPDGKTFSPPATVGYQYLTQATTRSASDNGLTLKTTTESGLHPTISLTGDVATEVITGYGILKTTEEHVPLVVQRRHGKNTVYVWAVSLNSVPVALKVLAVKDESGKPLASTEAVAIRVGDGQRQRSMLVNPTQKKVVASLPDGSAWSSSAVFAVK
ncbi:MAG: Heparinase family protein [Pedosphaera sp.]|nr:Heparinase family protein [Pedosphaera sp.]